MVRCQPTTSTFAGAANRGVPVSSRGSAALPATSWTAIATPTSVQLSAETSREPLGPTTVPFTNSTPPRVPRSMAR